MGDQRERIADAQESSRSMLDDFAANLWTCLPGIVQSFNAQKNTCVVQPAIKIKVRQKDGSFKWMNLPLLLDVPVQWPGGGSFLITFPLAQNDEVEIHFSDRCIDAWYQSGGIQLQPILRLHDLSDAFVRPKLYSLPNVPPNISTTTAQLRNFAGTAYIELAAGGVINIVAPGGLNVNGNQSNTGTVTASGEGTFNGGHTVSQHVHGGVTPGSGSTAKPTG